MTSSTARETTPQPGTWQERTARRWWRLKEADQALNLAQSVTRQGLINRLVRMTQNRGWNLPDNAGAGEDDMNLNLGDIFYEQAPPPPQRGDGGLLGKIALAAVASLGVGLPLGVGMALPTILDLLRPPAADTNTDTDTDTVTRFEWLSPGEDGYTDD